MNEHQNCQILFPKKKQHNIERILGICMDTLEQNKPWKQKYTRGNHLPFMNKTIWKEIMLRNQFFKNKGKEISKELSCLTIKKNKIALL